MYMQLSTGTIEPKFGKYGIDNLKVIVRACVNFGKVISQLRANPVPKKFWGKLWFWIKGLFSSRQELADIGADIVQLAANADAIKSELADLDAMEAEQLINMLVFDIGVGTPTRFLHALPALLDAVKAIADFID